MKKLYFALFCLGLAIFLCGFIDNYNQDFLYEKGLSASERDIFYRTLGEFTDYLSDMSYVKADIYFHGGIYGSGKKEKHGTIKDETSEHGHEHKHHDHAGTSPAVKPGPNILPDIAKAIRITEHKHLRDRERKEIVPWIYYSVKLNPENARAYAVGGFWLAIKLHKIDEAVEFLKKGLTDNPKSWDICLMLGQIYFLKKNDYHGALTYLERAKKLADSEGADSFDKRNVYSLLAETYLKLGEKEKALRLYEAILELFPSNETIKDKMEHLRSGTGTGSTS